MAIDVITSGFLYKGLLHKLSESDQTFGKILISTQIITLLEFTLKNVPV